MKVILLRDVAKMGRRGQVIEIPDGHALNQLIPKKWAEAATPANMKKLQASQAGVAASASAKHDVFSAAVEVLKAKPLTITASANEQGHLFKAIHESDIVAAAKALGANLEVKSISIETAIKSVGEHTIVLKHQAMQVPYTVTIIKQ